MGGKGCFQLQNWPFEPWDLWSVEMAFSFTSQHPEMSLVLLRRWNRVSAGSKPCS